MLEHWIDTGVILGVVIVNALIGFIQEGKAEKALEAITQMLSLDATVIRDGKRQTMAAEDLVPGDVVALRSGGKVPADLRLIEVRELRIDEAMLTGESVPVEKTTEAIAENTALGDRGCIAFSGTLVTTGRGAGVVVATGDKTELGKISEMVSQTHAITTPLIAQMNRFGHILAVVIVIFAVLTFALGYFVGGGEPVELFLAAVALAVAAIPEGLPAIMTIVLAIGVQRPDFEDVQHGLTMLGLAGIIDPTREEAIRAVEHCHEAGIRVVMITGDHALTARAIGAELGIGDSKRALTGQDVDALEEMSGTVADKWIARRTSGL